MGRFIQPDPIVQSLTNLQSLNRYAYTFNNPLTYIDPNGKRVELPDDRGRDCDPGDASCVTHPINRLSILYEDDPQRLMSLGREAFLQDVDYAESLALARYTGQIGTAQDLFALPIAFSVGRGLGIIAGDIAGLLAPGAQAASSEVAAGGSAVMQFTRRQVHQIGVAAGRATAQAQGLELTGWQNPFANRGAFGQGFDDIMRGPTGDPVIVEYKGGSSRLAVGQMEEQWVRRNIERLRQVGDPTFAELRVALSEGRLSGVVYSTPIKSGIIQPTKATWIWYGGP